MHLNRRRIVAIVATLLICACEPATQAPASVDLDISGTRTEHVAVVFIHGVMGNPELSFKADSAKQSWPVMLASDPRFKEAPRVISLAYQSGALRRASNINEIAVLLNERLRTKQLFEHADKVIFVTHSMGGLVARRMLIQLSISHPEDYAKVAGIFFFGTPSGGAEVASIMSVLSRNPQFNDMNPIELNTFLQAEDDSWGALLRRRTVEAPYPKSFCAYEKYAVGNMVIVARNRALTGCDETAMPFESDHINLVKPATRADDVYAYVATHIRKLVADEYIPFNVKIALVTPNGTPLPMDLPLYSGDMYALQISSTRPCWIYVFNEDSRRIIERYYPTKRVKQEQPSKTFRIPADPKQALRLDAHAGTERVLVLASFAPRADLESGGQEIDSQSGNASVGLRQKLQKRGAYEANVASAVSRKVPMAYKISRQGEDVSASLTFLHLPYEEK